MDIYIPISTELNKIKKTYLHIHECDYNVVSLLCTSAILSNNLYVKQNY